MGKRNVRAGGTYLVKGDPGDNPKLMGRELQDGRDSLYLEYYFGYEKCVSASGREYKKARRETEPLGLYLWRAPRSKEERDANRETMDLARRVMQERARQFQGDQLGVRSRRACNLLAWLRGYADRRFAKGNRCSRTAYRVLVDFLNDPDDVAAHERVCDPEKSELILVEKEKKVSLPVARLTPQFARDYRDYLVARYAAQSASAIYGWTSGLFRAAVEADIIGRNPFSSVRGPARSAEVAKDILDESEISALMATPCRSPEVKRAFLFSLYTGLRFCDVARITHGDIDRANRLLRFEQSKTRGHSSRSRVTIPLNDGIMQLIGTGAAGDRIFPLKTYSAVIRQLKMWIEEAGIAKRITWHCARHSFAVNVLSRGADIKTVSGLLGHSSVAMTDKYLHVVDELKKAAIDSLPELHIPK